MSDLTEPRIPAVTAPPPIQRLPLLQLILVGLQHVLLMYGGAVAVPLIIGQAAGLSREEIAFLINADLLAVAGVATIVQSWGIGPMGIHHAGDDGRQFCRRWQHGRDGRDAGHRRDRYFRSNHCRRFLRNDHFAPFMSKVVRFFPPLVTGTVITSIGLSLFPVAVNWAGGGSTAAQFGSPIYLFYCGAGAGHHFAHQSLYARFLGQRFGTDRHGTGLCPVWCHRHGQLARHRPGAVVPDRHAAALRHA